MREIVLAMSSAGLRMTIGLRRTSRAKITLSMRGQHVIPRCAGPTPLNMTLGRSTASTMDIFST
eukprot:7556912-Pyramimonas_sp.AAC.1